MIVFKWFCFILVGLDFVGYISEKAQNVESIGNLIGFILGIVGRTFVLYGTVTCWLLA